MKAVSIIFNEYDCIGSLELGFKIDLFMKELAVQYKNNQGGYTSNGIKLNDKQLNAVCLFSIPGKFIKYRDKEKLIDRKELYIIDDTGWWNFEMRFDDGTLPLMIECGAVDNRFEKPSELNELIKYVLQIGAFNNR